jgi:phosphate transport system substrate-binding protein
MSNKLGRWATFFGLLLLLGALSACSSDPDPSPPFPTLTPFPPDIYIGLSDSANPFADLVLAKYGTASGQAAPVFISGNDQALLEDLRQGVLEAVIVHHLPAGSQEWFTPVALDGVVMVAHAGLGKINLTSSELQGILGGSFNNWDELGGPELPITILSRESGSGSRDILQERILQNVRVPGSTRIAATDNYMRQEVAANPGAIGYTMMGNINGDSILLDGHAATPESVSDQSYPLTAPLYFVTLSEPGGPFRDFLAWLQSANGQTTISEKYGRVR